MGLGGRDRVSRTVMFPCVRGSDIVWGWALAPVVKLRDEVVHVPWRTWSQESVNQLVPEPALLPVKFPRATPLEHDLVG